MTIWLNAHCVEKWKSYFNLENILWKMFMLCNLVILWKIEVAEKFLNFNTVRQHINRNMSNTIFFEERFEFSSKVN